MSSAVPLLRMFAGPNGSGKTTVKKSLSKPESWFGIYINPDELEASIRQSGVLSRTFGGMKINPESLINYFATSQLLLKNGMTDVAQGIEIDEININFDGITFNSYHASVLSDYLRRCALEERLTFSFETVMSSRDKVDLLRTAQSYGYRTYLYFVATADPNINIQRVKNRVATGGHDVPINKIVERYHRSLNLLSDAISATNRTFLFDTSGDQAWYFAEVTDGEQIDLQTDEIPTWFQQVWDIAEEN